MLVKSGINNSEIEKINSEIDEIVETAVLFSKESEEPSAEELYTDIYRD